MSTTPKRAVPRRGLSDPRQEWALEANRSAARAVQAWAAGRGFAAEIADLRVAGDGQLIAAPGLPHAIQEIEESSIEACNRADVIYRLAVLHPEPVEQSRIEEEFEKLYEYTSRTEYWMRRLAELCKGISAHLASTDAIERTDRAAVIAVKQWPAGEELLGDGLWPRSRNFPEFITELAGYFSRMIVDHNCRLAMTPATGEKGVILHSTIDQVGNVELRLEGAPLAAVDGLIELGWRQDLVTKDAGPVNDLIATWDDPLPVMEPITLIVESLEIHLGITSPGVLVMEIF